jgi:outer membrane lipoprotein-sorting protein
LRKRRSCATPRQRSRSRPRTILHEQALVSADGRTWQPYEVWIATGDPQSFRVIKFGRELSRDGSVVSNYDAATNTVTHEPAVASGTGPGPVDLAAEMRSMLQSGQARVSGAATVDGTPAYRLTLGPGSAATPQATAYVAQADYRPLLVDYSANGGETIRFETYEYIRATCGVCRERLASANLGALDVTASHPGARLVTP